MFIQQLQEKIIDYRYDKERFKLNDSYHWLTSVRSYRRMKDKLSAFTSCVKNKNERAKYGIGHRDIWSAGDYFLLILVNGLRTLARDAHGWPGTKEFGSFEGWQETLLQIADSLESTMEPYPILLEYKNLEMTQKIYGHDSEEAKAAAKVWIAAEDKASQERIKIRKEAFAWIAEHCDQLWD